MTDNDSGESTRWYINPLYTPNLGHSIYSAGRGSTSTYVYSIEPDDYSAIVSAEARVRKYEAKSTLAYTGNFNKIPNTNSYKIGYSYGPIFMGGTKIWLQAKGTTTDTYVTYEDNSETARAFWKIVPAGGYTVVDIKYVQTDKDLIAQNQDFGNRRTLSNPTDAAVILEHNVIETVTESSTFMNPETIELKTSGQVSTPIVDSLGHLESSSSMSINRMDFGTSKSSERTIGDKVIVVAPPHSSIIVETTRRTYDISVTYVATVQSNIYGKRFRIKGKYTGSVFTDIIVAIKNADGSLISRQSISKVIETCNNVADWHNGVVLISCKQRLSGIAGQSLL